jgi:Ca2+/H+ antiporter
MFKLLKPDASKNFTKFTSRKILAIWLTLTVILTIVTPKIFDLKDMKSDNILLMMLFISTLIMILLIFIIRFFTTVKQTDKKDQ